ncbi:MAG: amidohydrolase/deacetylase family metallohydrolase [Chloroflexi bacterium]|nr:amidohydrolase/deacetylase family metallohydrolase [Chloroflexota bacterium]
MPAKYDLLLKGGTVVDPSQKLNTPRDVAVQGGKIARTAQNIPAEEAAQVVNVRGKIVTPGLIDIHAHIYEAVTNNGVNPDVAGVYAGVTTVVDAGSAGCDTFGGFPRFIIPQSQTEIICFMHIARTGLARTPDIQGPGDVNLDATLQAVERYRPYVRGIKARMVSPALEIMGIEMPRLAKRAAKESGIKLMVHIGDTEKRYPADIIRELLPILEPGDILTHFFTANPGGVLDANGKLVPEAREAKDRGVWLDTAHGRMNFAFDIGKRILDQGLLPHCISTDLTVPGRQRTVHSMTEMMTRFLGLGFTLDDVVTMCTLNPAKALGEENRLGTLGTGRQADISVLEIRDGDWEVVDVVGGKLRVQKAVVPVLAVKRGQVFTAQWGPRPWGWEPDPASK